MKAIYADSIDKAKSYYDGFDDAIHGLEHSHSVAQNAAKTAQAVGYKDIDFLKLCAYWHDTARAKGVEPHEEAGAIMARDDLLARGASQEESNKAYEAIRFHKSTASPITIEGKIIRDADKLDIFNIERWKRCDKAGWKKEYVEDLQKTVRNMGKYPDLFTFDITKELFKTKSKEFLVYYDSIKDKLSKQT